MPFYVPYCVQNGSIQVYKESTEEGAKRERERMKREFVPLLDQVGIVFFAETDEQALERARVYL